MEFLARSWSLSAMELSKALCNTNDDEPPLLASEEDSPRGSDDTKEFFLLHQAINPGFLSNQHLLKNGHLHKSITKRKTTGRWIKDQKERKKQEIRAHNAQLHAAISVAGVAAAVAALAEKSSTKNKKSSVIASAAALVASHCIEMAEDMGANHDQILSVVSSAINVRTNGDVMTLTAGAATALRGASILRARLYKEHGDATISCKESNVSVALNFVSNGGELLKRTRKGDLHWKQVSFNVNSNWKVVAKMKSKHMGGTFTKKKKFVVSGVYSDVPAWPGRETESKEKKMAYFGIQSGDRVIEFECRSKGDKQMWVEGIKQMLHLHVIS